MPGPISSPGGVPNGTNLKTSAGAVVVNADNRTLLDSGSVTSVDWENRTLIGEYGAIDWNARTIAGSWNIDNLKLLDEGTLTLGTNGDFYIESGGNCLLAIVTADQFVGNGSAITGLIALDSGWTANSDAGDKTKVIGSSASLATIATALNLVTSGAGTQLQNIAEKVKALETALAARLLPNT